LVVKFSRYIAVLSVGLTAAFGISSPSLAAGAVVHVAAAANLKQCLDQGLVPSFETATGSTVTVTYGSTQLLARQLENGKPEDVFLSADTKTVDKLVKEKILVASSERVYAIGQLVLWTRADATLHPSSIRDLSNPAYANIAIANPKLAPYGAAAMESLASAGMTSVVAGRIIQAGNIGEALQYAKTGNTDAAFTALSLVIKDKKDPYIIIPGTLHGPIAQSAALVASGSSSAGASFLRFISSKQAAPIWKSYGYALPGSKR
jgi:molybdate transport system substrate-binding protein